MRLTPDHLVEKWPPRHAVKITRKIPTNRNFSILVDAVPRIPPKYHRDRFIERSNNSLFSTNSPTFRSKISPETF